MLKAILLLITISTSSLCVVYAQNRLHGNLFDKYGNPAKKASIRLYSSSSLIATFYADTSGHYDIPLPDSTVTIIYKIRGYLRHQLSALPLIAVDSPEVNVRMFDRYPKSKDPRINNRKGVININGRHHRRKLKAVKRYYLRQQHLHAKQLSKESKNID